MTKIINVEGSILRIEKIKPQYEFTEDQNNALEAIRIWLYNLPKSPDNCFFSLKGSAGTGKTSVVSYLLQNLEIPYKRNTCVSAPTHKAKKVIHEKSQCPNSATVQALLGLKPDVDLENFDVNNPVFSVTNKKEMNNYNLIVIDESSMINNDLFGTICDEAIKNHIKILFVGDELQLPPINEVISMSLIKPQHSYTLTQIVRQENTNPLINLLSILRDDIINNTFNYVDFLNKNVHHMMTKENEKGEMVDIEGFSVVKGRDCMEVMSEVFKSDEFKENRNHVRYISWTNKSIKGANDYIRKNIFNFDTPIFNNELLLSYKTLVDKDEAIIINSDDYIVKSQRLETDYLGIDLIKTEIQPLDSEDIKENSKFLNIVFPSKDNYDRYLEERDNKLQIAIARRGKAWVDYYSFRNSYILLESLFDGKKLLDKKDLDYGYGITIHKSQGSTYNTVIVNAKDINLMETYCTKQSNENDQMFQQRLNRARTDVKKLWYVALSRASNKAYIYL